MKLDGQDQVVLDLIVDHELLHIDPPTEDVLFLAAPPDHDQHTGPVLNKLVADGLVTKTKVGPTYTYRLTRLGLAHARRVVELDPIAIRLSARWTTLSASGYCNWTDLVEGGIDDKDFYACLLIIRVLDFGELVSTTAVPRGARWRSLHVEALKGALTNALLAPQTPSPNVPPTSFALPSHEPSLRIAELRTWRGYVELSSEYQGAKAWLKLALALITLIPLLVPLKFKDLSLQLSFASGVYFTYHASNLLLFIEVKQAASPAAALKRTSKSFDRLCWYHDKVVYWLGIAVYVLIALSIGLKVWAQCASSLPSAVRTFATWIGLPA